MRPSVQLEAARERGGVSHDHDHLRVECLGDPLGREERHRVLHQRAQVSHAIAQEAAAIANQNSNVALGAHAASLSEVVVTEVEEASEVVGHGTVRTGTDIGEPVGKSGTADAWAAIDVERFVDVPD